MQTKTKPVTSSWEGWQTGRGRHGIPAGHLQARTEATGGGKVVENRWESGRKMLCKLIFLFWLFQRWLVVFVFHAHSHTLAQTRTHSHSLPFVRISRRALFSRRRRRHIFRSRRHNFFSHPTDFPTGVLLPFTRFSISFSTGRWQERRHNELRCPNAKRTPFSLHSKTRTRASDREKSFLRIDCYELTARLPFAYFVCQRNSRETGRLTRFSVRSSGWRYCGAF